MNTETHVDWILEVLLVAFELPLSKWEQIDTTIDIYSKWLMKPSDRLKPMQKNPQIYLRRMFSHFSLLFERRSTVTSKDDEKNHIYLTNRILAIFLEMATIHGDKMDDETWEYGFKMLLGITDITLTSKTKGIKNLSYGVLKTVFEYWICSLSYDVTLWKLFQKFASRWANYLPTVRQWTSICEALTLRVVRILYSKLEGTDSIQIEWQGLNSIDNPNQKVGNHITHLELPDEYSLFLWEQMLHVIGNPNNIQNTQVFLTALQGIDCMTGILATVGSAIDVDIWRTYNLSIPYPPNTNSILRIFESWLLEAVNTKTPEFNNGKAVAYKALCAIFCRRGGKPPSEDNLSLFYYALEIGLNNSDPLITSAIILHSAKIFTLELEGVFILIPTYVELCKQILCSNKSMDSDNPPQLRSECITILSALICLPNHYLSQSAGTANLPNTDLWYNLKISIRAILLEALNQENNQHNLQHILWCVSVFIHEHIDSDPETCKSFILALCDLLRKHGEGKPPTAVQAQVPPQATPDDGAPSVESPAQQQELSIPPEREFSPTVLITLLESLSSVVPLYEKVKTVFPEFGLSIVGTIARHIPAQILLLKQNESLYTQFLVQAYVTMLDFLHCAGNVIFKNSLVVEQVVSAVSAGRIASKTLSNSNSFVQKVERAAEFTLIHILNFIGIFPGTNEHADTISHISDKLLLTELEQKKEFWDSEYVRFFLLEDQYIFTVIEQPPRTDDGKLDLHNTDGDSGCTVVVRDISGKHVWDGRLLYEKPPQPISEIRPIDKYQGSSLTGLNKNTKPHPNNETLLKFKIPVMQEVEKSSSLPVDNFSQMMDLIESTENEIHSARKAFFDKINMSAQPPVNPLKYEYECKFQMSRLLLTQLGFFDYGTLNKMCQLRPSDALVQELQELDVVHQRENFDIGVLYVAPYQDTEHDILTNTSCTDTYSRFLSALGWNVESNTESPINTGKLSQIHEKHHAPYWSGVDSELVFHVTTRMPNEPLQNKKNLISSNFVNIVWTEHTRPYFTPIIKESTPHQCHVIIHPMQNKLLDISKRVTSGDRTLPFVGPLCDGMVISEKISPLLVRQTSMNCIRMLRLLDREYAPPFQQREKQIQHIARSHKVKLSGREYYSFLFNSDKKLVSRTQKHMSQRHSVAKATMLLLEASD
eukprot:CAMPEP_0117451124 /NCGR_PEP_ID=MMETSP0759-20121206/8839_1 /TAXON_ID=63605 /ORGANISM="Percolomonas cosmopolitus, Strain WS" /LENGTH=1163 /DNA_ID=CAMNT_0005243701 /DNA_START=338 /DNA_END=3827 /DNA_ORIENTATION=-